MELVDAIGRIADDHVRALLLEQQGASTDEIARRLGIVPESVDPLLQVAHAKLARLEQAAGSEA